MRRVVARLEDRLRTDPAEVIVIYLNPRHEQVFAASDVWMVSERTEASVVIRGHAPST
jgi:hypothetical protein